MTDCFSCWFFYFSSFNYAICIFSNNSNFLGFWIHIPCDMCYFLANFNSNWLCFLIFNYNCMNTYAFWIRVRCAYFFFIWRNTNCWEIQICACIFIFSALLWVQIRIWMRIKTVTQILFKPGSRKTCFCWKFVKWFFFRPI